MTSFPIRIRSVTLQLGNAFNKSQNISICMKKGVHHRNDHRPLDKITAVLIEQSYMQRRMGNTGSQDELKSKPVATTGRSTGLSKVRGAPGKSQSLALHVKQASSTGVFTFKDFKLVAFPFEIFQLKNLRTLDLSRNSIVAVPSEIAAFQALRALTLHTNQIEMLPDDIGLCKKLEILNLSNNRLATIPETFLSLKSLKSLELCNNLFPIFPPSLCFLPNIAIIDLSFNNISELPDSISDLNTHELNLATNSLTSLPSQLAKCPYLKVLKVENNRLKLTTIPHEILSFSKISLIKVEGNLFTETQFQTIQGYDKYEGRYSATKSKSY